MQKNHFLLWIFLILYTVNIKGEEATIPESKSLANDQSKLRFNGKLFYSPLLSINSTDEEESLEKDQISPSIKNGYGYGAYLGIDVVDYFDYESFHLGFGLIFQESLHDFQNASYHLTADTLLFEPSLYNTFYRSKVITIYQQIGLGGGMTSFLFDKEKDSFYTGIFSTRYLIGFEFYHHYDIEVGGGAFIWGEPSDTKGYGGFFQLQIGFRY